MRAIHIQSAHLRLFRAHVGRSANHLGVVGEKRLFRQLLVRCFRNPKVNHLRQGVAIVQSDHHIARLDVPVDDPFLVGMEQSIRIRSPIVSTNHGMSAQLLNWKPITTVILLIKDWAPKFVQTGI